MARKKGREEVHCKHGMVQTWCAYCQGEKTQIRAQTTGRGVGRMTGDTRPMHIWRKGIT